MIILKDKSGYVTSPLKTQPWLPNVFILKSKFLALAWTTFCSSLTVPPFLVLCYCQGKIVHSKRCQTLSCLRTFALAFFPLPGRLPLAPPSPRPTQVRDTDNTFSVQLPYTSRRHITNRPYFFIGK